MGKPPFSEDKHPMDQPVRWSKIDDAEFPYEAQVEGKRWVIRVNDWPEEPTVFSLLVDGDVYLNFDGWGALWNKPA